MQPLLAQVGGYSLVHLLILAIVIGAAVAITLVVLKQMGVTPPAFVIQILWMILACVIGVAAILFIMRVVGGAGL